MEINDSERILMLLLLVIWAGLLFGGFLRGRLNTTGTHRIPTPARMASSFTLVIAAWAWVVINPDSDQAVLVLLLAGGMTLGFIGDLFMAQLLPIKDYVLAGMAAFGLGHVVYISGLVIYGNSSNLNDNIYRWGALLVWVVFAIIGWFMVVYLGGKRADKISALHLAALPYAVLLASTAGFATGLALQMEIFITLAIGAGLFLLSDLILAAQLFNGLHFRSIGDLVWFTYGPGQMLIVFALPLATIF